MAIKTPQEFSNTITAVPNPLSAFSSSSYTISWYLLTQEQSNEIMTSKTRSVAGLKLLMQSGGARSASKSQTTDSKTAARSQYFDVDFHIDDVKVTSTQADGGSAAISSALTFTVIEPYGITLIERLRLAIKDLAAVSGRDSFLSQPYLMVIRFYGYDAAGRPVKNVEANVSDSSAAYEKFLPFLLTKLEFRVKDNMVEYAIAAQPVGHIAARGGLTGAIPTNIGVSGATVQDMLAGETVGDSGVRSLAAAINKYHKDNTPTGQVPTKISIEFSSASSIGSAVVKKFGPVSKSKTSQPAATTAENQLLPSKGSVAVSQRNHEFIAGTPIVWAISQIIQASSYITDQQNIDISETGVVSPKPTNINKSAQWFNIIVNPTLEYDPVANLYVKHITYTVVPYLLYLDTPTMPVTDFRGVHKRYDYWFTGANNEVLHFEQSYNALFAYQLGGAIGVGSYLQSSNPRYLESANRAVVTASSGGSPQGAVGGNTDPAATVAARLYSPDDVAKSTITIIGDPHWLTEFRYMDAASSFGPYVSDGSTISFNTQEVLYEINFNTPADYDHSTGLMQIHQDSQTPGVAPVSFVYRAITVTSSFKDGKFVQEIIGTLRTFMPTNSSSSSTDGQTTSRQSGLDAISIGMVSKLGSGIPSVPSTGGFLVSSPYQTLESSVDTAGATPTTLTGMTYGQITNSNALSQSGSRATPVSVASTPAPVSTATSDTSHYVSTSGTALSGSTGSITTVTYYRESTNTTNVVSAANQTELTNLYRNGRMTKAEYTDALPRFPAG